MILTIEPSTPTEFKTTAPDVLHERLTKAVAAAASRLGIRDPSGGEYDVIGELAGDMRAAYESRLRRLALDVAALADGDE